MGGVTSKQKSWYARTGSVFWKKNPFQEVFLILISNRLLITYTVIQDMIFSKNDPTQDTMNPEAGGQKQYHLQ